MRSIAPSRVDHVLIRVLELEGILKDPLRVWWLMRQTDGFPPWAVEWTLGSTYQRIIPDARQALPF